MDRSWTYDDSRAWPMIEFVNLLCCYVFIRLSWEMKIESKNKCQHYVLSHNIAEDIESITKCMITYSLRPQAYRLGCESIIWCLRDARLVYEFMSRRNNHIANAMHEYMSLQLNNHYISLALSNRIANRKINAGEIISPFISLQSGLENRIANA